MRDDQHLSAEDGLDPHAVAGDLAIGGGVRAELEQRGVFVWREGVGREGGVHGETASQRCRGEVSAYL